MSDFCGNEEVTILSEMPKRNPTSGSFELTIRCNLHCKMCMFRHDDSENAEIMAKELTADQWIDLARQVAEAGTLSLLITGGEPLLRPDFCEIWEGIYKQGFLLTLYTNATLVTDQVMKTLRKYPPHRIGVTIYGASSETYEKVTGSAEGFQRMMRGLECLSSLPSIIEYRTTIIKDLRHDLDAIEQIVKDHSNGQGKLTESRNVFPAVRGGCADARSCRIDAKENVVIMIERAKKRAIAEAKEKGYILKSFQLERIKDEPGMLSKKEVFYTLLGCGGGMSTFAILFDGRLVPCQMLDQFSVDLTKTSFSKGWFDLPWQIKLPKLCEKCASCEDFSYCEACPASRYAETGDMGGWSDYFCEDARELKKYYLQETMF